MNTTSKTSRFRMVLCRNRECLLFGLGWPGFHHLGERRIYVYVGPWLMTLTRAADR